MINPQKFCQFYKEKSSEIKKSSLDGQQANRLYKEFLNQAAYAMAHKDFSIEEYFQTSFDFMLGLEIALSNRQKEKTKKWFLFGSGLSAASKLPSELLKKKL